MIEKADAQGSYIEIFDANNSVVYSNKEDGDLIDFDIELILLGMIWTVKNYINKDFIEKNTNDINKEIMLALLISALIIIPLNLYTNSIITSPIATLRKVTDQLAQGNGDLTNRITVDSHDDLGKIANNINAFIAQLQAMVLQVSRSREVIELGVNTLNEHSDSNQSLLVHHVTETDMVVTAITQMSSTGESVSESTALAATLTQKVDNGVNESRKIVDEAVHSVASLAEEVETMSSAIVHMSDHTDRIGIVLGVIGDIAEQTNLLALNAAKTQNSTSEINQMLQELQLGTKSVVDAMAITRTSCQRSADKTAKVTIPLDSMSNEISDINNHTIQIATSAEEQCIVAEEIAQNMTTIKAVISENGSITANTTKELTNANTELNQIVGKFNF